MSLLFLPLLLFAFFRLPATVNPAQVTTHHRCLDTKSHKNEPGPEDVLHKQCTPWANFSCCTHGITQQLHEMNLYNFNFSHCPQKKNLSEECKKHFIQDLCFYECSPNIGPWIVKVDMKIRKERFFGVPLCRSECEAWFSACADDYTCTDNWVKNFVWDRSGNKCMKDAECAPFRDVFLTAKNFCEKVWDGSWEVVDDTEPCMKIWFDPSYGNPNEKVAMLKMKELNKYIVLPNSALVDKISFVVLTLAVLFTIVCM